MTTLLTRAGVSALALAGGFLAASLPASADTFAVQYYSAPTGSPDFHNGDANIGVSYNYVLPSLGPNGLPVFNSSFTTASGNVDSPNSAYLSATGELLYWTPTASNMLTTDGGPTTSVLSGTSKNMFPPGGAGTTNATSQETAIFKGQFTLAAPTSVTFKVGADDTAFVYVDNSLVESLGGIHSNMVLDSSAFTFGTGTHSIELFYADHDISLASLSFSTNGAINVVPPTSPVPEPNTLVLLGTGLVAAAGAVRRRLLV